MAKISENGLSDIKNRLKTTLDAIAQTLEDNGQLFTVQEQIAAALEIIVEIERDWEVIED